LRMNNNDPFLHQKAKQYELLGKTTTQQINCLIAKK